MVQIQADPLMSDEQTAEYLGVTKGTLQVWRSTGRYALPFVKVGRLVRYRLSDVEKFVTARSVTASHLAVPAGRAQATPA